MTSDNFPLIELRYEPEAPLWVLASDILGNEVTRGVNLASVVDRLRFKAAPEDLVLDVLYPGGFKGRLAPSTYASEVGEWLSDEDLLEPEVFAARYVERKVD